MFPKFAAFAVVALAVSISARADLIIESKVESPQLNTNITTKIKGNDIRADLTSPMGAISTIINGKTGDSVSLLHGQKMAMKSNAAQTKQAIEMAKQLSGATGKTDAPAKPAATGQKEKVGEYNCEIYALTSGNVSSRFWVASKHPLEAQLKSADQLMRSGALGAATSGNADTTALPGAILKTETTVANTKTVTTVLDVKENPVDAKEFEVPAGYTAMEMPNLAPGGAPAPGAK